MVVSQLFCCCFTENSQPDWYLVQNGEQAHQQIWVAQCILAHLILHLLPQDGTQIQHVDSVIYCTGYQYAYPFLEGTGLVTSHDMRVDPLWQHIFPPAVAPTLAFVGLVWKSIRNQQFEIQVRNVSQACKCSGWHQGSENAIFSLIVLPSSVVFCTGLNPPSPPPSPCHLWSLPQ